MKIFIIFFNLVVLLFAENNITTIDIIPPNLKNMENYQQLLNNKSTDNNKSTINNNNVLNNKNYKNKNNNIKIIKNDIKKQSVKNNNVITTIYKNRPIVSDVISNQKIDKCIITAKNIYEKGYEKGYEIGLKNSKYEIETWLKKFKKYLDSIFTIKDYYIEGILEPPMITFDNKSYIKDNGKIYIKKEGEYIITRPAKFRKPLTWEDFLLSGHLEKPIYILKYNYYSAIECKKDIKNIKIKKNFLNGYNYAKKESLVLYKERLKKLKIYLMKLNMYQRLYLTKKILPPVITPMITPIKTNGKNLVISEEQYIIVKDAVFNPLYKNWLNFIISNNNIETINKR